MNTVLIGHGYWGPNIAKNLKRSNKLNLYGICDISEKALDRARAIYGESVRYYTDYEEVLKDPAVEACAVALRNTINQTVARAVLRAGKHLFMEKPMAMSMENALILKRLGEENHVTIHVDHILVYNPVIRRLKEMVDSGEMGSLIYFESNRANLGPHIKNDMNVIWDLAVHDVAVMDYLFNAPTPTDITCRGIAHYGDREELTYMTVMFPEMIAMFKSSWISPLKERSMLVCGTKKMAVFNDLQEPSQKLSIYDKGVDISENAFHEYGHFEAKIRTGDLYVPYLEPEDSLLNSLNHFADCVKTGKPSITGPDEAIRVLEIITRADQSLHGKEA